MSKYPLAVQSFCFRGFKDNAQVASLVKKIGLDAIELCGVHVDFNKPETFDAVIKTYRDAGVKIVSIGVEGIGKDEAAVRKRFDFLRKVGAQYMSVVFAPENVPDCYRLAEKLADEYQVKLGIHNHGGYHWLGSIAMLKYVFSVTGRQIGLCLDTAWAMQTGQPALEFVEKLGDRLTFLHAKDFIFGRDARWQDVVVGTGNLDLTKLRAALDKLSFRGPIVLEYEGDVNDPTPALTKCVEALKKVF